MTKDPSSHPAAVPDAPDAEWESLARYFVGEGRPAEADEVRARLRANPADAEILATLNSAIAQVVDRAPADIDVEGALRRVKARRDSEGRQAIPLNARGRVQR